jgi:hypothetical protein
MKHWVVGGLAVVLIGCAHHKNRGEATETPVAAKAQEKNPTLEDLSSEQLVALALRGIDEALAKEAPWISRSQLREAHAQRDMLKQASLSATTALEELSTVYLADGQADAARLAIELAWAVGRAHGKGPIGVRNMAHILVQSSGARELALGAVQALLTELGGETWQRVGWIFDLAVDAVAVTENLARLMKGRPGPQTALAALELSGVVMKRLGHEDIYRAVHKHMVGIFPPPVLDVALPGSVCAAEGSSPCLSPVMGRPDCHVWTLGSRMVTWTGGCQGGLALGEGRVDSLKGGVIIESYFLKILEGGREAVGEARATAGVSYAGQFVDLSCQGRGRYSYPDGGVQEGEFKNCRLNGQGVWVLANGVRCEGEWRDDKQNGHGACVNTDGSRYEGEWRDDKFSGQGLRVYADGVRCEGPSVPTCVRQSTPGSLLLRTSRARLA